MSHQEFYETVERKQEYMEQIERNENAVVNSAFLRAQMKFGPALKSANNPHFRSKYADLAACVDAVIDALNSEGLALTQETLPHPEGVAIRTILLHSGGGRLFLGELFMPAIKLDPQGFGSALTYCRRYSLLAAMGVAPEDDDGNSASKAAPKANARISATMGAFESLHPDRQSMVTDVSVAIKIHFAQDDIVGAYEEYNGLTDVEEKTALWSLLDSKMRSAIKKHGESLKETNVT
jgi:hypothetical protein